MRSRHSDCSEPFIQSEGLVDVGVVVGVQLEDVGVCRPKCVVHSSPSHLDLVISRCPAGDHSVGENLPCIANSVSQFKASVDDHVLISAEAVSVKLDVVNSLSHSVRFASADEVEGVLSFFGNEFDLFVVDLVVSGNPLLDSFSIELNSKAIAVLGD